MRLMRGKLSPRLETIPRDPVSSFASRRFKVPHFPFEWHYHPEAELTYIVEGAGLRFVGNSIDSFRPGDLVLLGPNVPHTWQSTISSDDQRSTSAEAIVIQFLPGLWGDAINNLPEFRGIRQLLKDASKGLHIDHPLVRQKVRDEMENVVTSPPGSMQQLIGLLQALRIVADGRSQYRKTITSISAPRRIDPRLGDAGTQRLQRVLEQLNQSLDAGARLTQASAAHSVKMSPAAFSRFFRNKVGRTFTQYVNEWRIGLICSALLQPESSITEIAFASGFENLSNFNRRFRQVKGITPREFRRLHASAASVVS
jgi:AraC-like DNA-binding protein